jgi:hypothetical protein
MWMKRGEGREGAGNKMAAASDDNDGGGGGGCREENLKSTFVYTNFVQHLHESVYGCHLSLLTKLA